MGSGCYLAIRIVRSIPSTAQTYEQAGVLSPGVASDRLGASPRFSKWAIWCCASASSSPVRQRVLLPESCSFKTRTGGHRSRTRLRPISRSPGSRVRSMTSGRRRHPVCRTSGSVTLWGARDVVVKCASSAVQRSRRRSPRVRPQSVPEPAGRPRREPAGRPRSAGRPDGYCRHGCTTRNVGPSVTLVSERTPL